MTIGYNWTCTACGAPNAAGTDICCQCRSNAVTSAFEIQKGANDRRVEQPRSKTQVGDIRALLLVLGLYLIAGSAYTFSSGKWFAGFPPQLDVFGVLPYGSMIEAIVGALLGVIAVIAAVIRRKQPRQGATP
jgi:hypothetical protein